MTHIFSYNRLRPPFSYYPARYGRMTRAYSYMRFSNLKQADGDSIRRQTALRDSWIGRNDVILDTSLKPDRGKSAFSGDNLKTGYLAEFVRLVGEGRIPAGSYLIVESLDRLSRQEVKKALRLILDLLERGIRIVQLEPREMVYDADASELDLILMIMELSRGHGESKMKSVRLREVNATKRAAMRERKAVNYRHPEWLIRTGMEWSVNGTRAETVRRIFDLAGEGYGLQAIARQLWAEGRECFGRKGRWTDTYIRLILTDGRAMGRATPKCQGAVDGPPVEGYYPPVVSPEQAEKAIAGLAQRKRHGGGSTHGGTNIFAGLLRSAKTGRTFQRHAVRTSKEVRAGKPARQMLVAGSDNEQGSETERVPYDWLERCVLLALAELDVAAVLGNHQAVDERDRLLHQLADVDDSLRALTEALKGRVSPALAVAVADKEAEREALAARLKEVARQTPDVQGAAWEAFQSLVRTLDAADDGRAVRLRIRSALRDVVSGMYLLVVRRPPFIVAALQVYFVGSDERREYLLLQRKHVGRPGRFTPPPMERVTSLRRPIDAEALDLRNPDDVRALAGELELMPLV